MTKEEYEKAIQNVRGFDFENKLPTYDGDIGPYQNFMDIKDEYIESLEKETEYLNNENHHLSRKIEELTMEIKLWKERYL